MAEVLQRGAALLVVLAMAWGAAGYAWAEGPGAGEETGSATPAEGGLKGVQTRTPALPADAVPAPEETQEPAAGRPPLPGAARVRAPSAPAEASPKAVEAATQRAAGTGAGTDAATGDGEASSTEASPDPALSALIEVLKDDEARARLLAELERLGAAAGAPAPPGQAPPGATTEEATPETTAPGRGQLIRDLGELTRSAAEDVAETLERFANGVILNVKRLRGFARTEDEELLRLVRELGLTVAITVGIFYTLRLTLLLAFRKLKRVAETAGTLRRIAVFVGAFTLDTLTVAAAWAAGYAVALFVLDPPGVTLLQTLYLNAFLAAGLAKAMVRAILAPSTGRPRPVPVSDRTAIYWGRWVALVISILAYGTLLVVPVVAEIANLFTARAVHILILLIVVVIGISLTVVHRRDLPRRFEGLLAEKPDDLTLKALLALARVLWIAVVAWFAVLYVLAVSNLSLVASYALTTLEIVGAVILAVVVSDWLGRASDRGVRLPEGMTARLPLLEQRLNGFVPNFLQALRLLIILAVLLFALHAVGLDIFRAQFDPDARETFVATVLSVIVMVLIAFAIWLALSSWIDYRLTPGRGRVVTARLETLLTLFRNAATIAIVTITLMFSLSELGIDIAPLIASAGVIGLAIGFGAQKLVQDIITGVFIQFENAINVGDYVEVGGIGGTVEKLTIRSVSLRDLHGTFHIVPFSSVDSVSNYMRGYAYHIADLGIAYREDVDEARDLMHRCYEALRSEPAYRFKVLGELEWFGVNALGDSAVVLRARIKCSPGNQWAVGRRYNELLKKACDEAGIEIPFPHMTVWFGEAKTGTAPPAHLRLEGSARGGTARDARHESPPESGPAPAISREPSSDMPDSNA